MTGTSCIRGVLGVNLLCRGRDGGCGVTGAESERRLCARVIVIVIVIVIVLLSWLVYVSKTNFDQIAMIHISEETIMYSYSRYLYKQKH